MIAIIAALLLSFVPAFFYSYLVYWLDRFEREPLKLVGGVFVWGAVFATASALVAEAIFQAGLEAATTNASFAEIATGAFFAPVVEELLKAFAILLVVLALRSEFDSLLDGLVYAGIVALGFSATENAFYLIGSFVEKGWGFFFGVFFLRVVLTGWNHAAFTAFTGAGVALARLGRTPLIKLAAPLGGLVLAIVLHATYNAMLATSSGGGLIFALCLSWFGWLVVLALVLFAIARDRTRARRYLADEVARGSLTRAQYRIASSALSGTFARLGALGSGHYWATRRFYQLCGELAQKKEQLEKYGEERGNAAAVASLRAEMTKLSSVAHA